MQACSRHFPTAGPRPSAPTRSDELCRCMLPDRRHPGGRLIPTSTDVGTRPRPEMDGKQTKDEGTPRSAAQGFLAATLHAARMATRPKQYSTGHLFNCWADVVAGLTKHHAAHLATRPTEGVVLHTCVSFWLSLGPGPPENQDHAAHLATRPTKMGQQGAAPPSCSRTTRPGR